MSCRARVTWKLHGCWAGTASRSARAPKVVAVDALAFYQPGTFGESGGRIEFMAPVRGYELTTRAELLRDEPEHPRAGEEYFKIQLGPLERLAQPVSGGKMAAVDIPVYHRGISAESSNVE